MIPIDILIINIEKLANHLIGTLKIDQIMFLGFYMLLKL
jgi:hypothetical protein